MKLNSLAHQDPAPTLTGQMKERVLGAWLETLKGVCAREPPGLREQVRAGGASGCTRRAFADLTLMGLSRYKGQGGDSVSQPLGSIPGPTGRLGLEGRSLG